MKTGIVFRGMHAGPLGRLAAEFLPERRYPQLAAGGSRKRMAEAEPDVMGGLFVAVFVAFMLAVLV